MTTAGELIEEGGTVCFDLALALEMAEADCASVAGSCVFLLDRWGGLADPEPLAAFGLPASDEARRDAPREGHRAHASRLS